MPSFAELLARSHYSFLEGSASPKRLVAVAAELGIDSLGLCDRNGLYGAVAFIAAAGAAGIHAVIGSELDLVDGSRLRFLVRDKAGYRQLSRAISGAQLAGAKGSPRLEIAGIGGKRESPDGSAADAVARIDPGDLSSCFVLEGGAGSALTDALLAG
ncbi:MAG TPA: PHP domain-containing protein, partial [Candidatus Sulfotelmatobacter sp.]|nr:PHP domain-containing protein [Candidatus Sulfotelmatobacter sp.]